MLTSVSKTKQKLRVLHTN